MKRIIIQVYLCFEGQAVNLRECRKRSQVGVIYSGQIITTSHDLTIKGSFLEGNSPYFRKIQVGEIL